MLSLAQRYEEVATQTLSRDSKDNPEKKETERSVVQQECKVNFNDFQ